MHTLAEFGVGEALWTMVWFTLIFLWIWIAVTCFMDIFRDQELSGWAKLAWLLFIVLFPYLGVFVYLVARGKGMQARSIASAQAHADATKQYIQSVAAPTGGVSVSEELARLADLRDKGTISDEEFRALKTKAMA